ncbi:hypothetical protein [Pantoea coffeiphila]|uniref:Uncharacterized protein n=1 Tax=Pantoea coffeiphila TaxID=1465635 RepID=A0A2S9I858_9GAMM|nr:hypothetical protein [Pantoea coffeiphila]PRD13980.1 hypothetical protein CQW29_18415 [Pantoea coffeiphila]
MAGLTKEQMAEREAATKQASEPTPPDSVDELPPGKMMMYRSNPLHPGGPVKASVHEAEVERWIEEGWSHTPCVEEE